MTKKEDNTTKAIKEIEAVLAKYNVAFEVKTVPRINVVQKPEVPKQKTIKKNK